MHVDEVSTDVALARRLVAAQFPEWAALGLEPVRSSGTDNALYRLGADMVLRLPRIHWAVEGEERAREWLPRLAPLLPVDVPVLVGVGEPAEGYPWSWSVYGWLEGENPNIDSVTDPVAITRDLAQLVEALRRVDLNGPLAGRGAPLATRDEPTRDAVAALEGVIDTEAAGDAWGAALRAPAWADPPSWVHGDLLPGNLLLRGGRLTGVIDWGCVGVGDPACDLIAAWGLLPAEARSLFRSELDVDDATWARGRGWALSIALIALPYYLDSNPAFADVARHLIGEVLAES
ncbi:MAG: aminoglycoside phosphotransferase family protein [Thermoleophilia bacterium]|nr:aminoglycoside phosphotransferase family protein [Thermoleophilia bacterium]MDH4340366.1 aminoglycoside phosphotransferase family protein [Thermoleophilia bacterium]MDH5280068.1 aminoglycoside phosphotransferase family protein [Thermoleophilia bacterium]